MNGANVLAGDVNRPKSGTRPRRTVPQWRPSFAKLSLMTTPKKHTTTTPTIILRIASNSLIPQLPVS